MIADQPADLRLRSRRARPPGKDIVTTSPRISSWQQPGSSGHLQEFIRGHADEFVSTSLNLPRTAGIARSLRPSPHRFIIRVGQPVDLGLGAFLGHGDQDAVGEVGVPAAQRDPAVVAEPADFGEDLLAGLSASGPRTP